MEDLFDEQCENIRIICGIETIDDPIEKNVTTSYLNGKPIKAIVSDISPTSASYKMPGIETEKTKEILIKKKYKGLLELSQKIKIRGEYYEGWRISGKLSYRIEGDYLRAYVYIKKV